MHQGLKKVKKVTKKVEFGYAYKSGVCLNFTYFKKFLMLLYNWNTTIFNINIGILLFNTTLEFFFNTSLINQFKTSI